MAYKYNKQYSNYNDSSHGKKQKKDRDYDINDIDINSLLDPDPDSEIILKSEKRQQPQHNNNNNNPLCRFLSYDAVYDRDDVYNVLVKKDGLVKMIEDLKKWKTGQSQQKPTYVYPLLRDIVFASALPEAMNKVLKKSDDNISALAIDKKDMDYLMDEILLFLNNSYNDPRLNQKYEEDSIESMRKAYTNILYKFNKKKVKKFKDIKDMPEAMAKRIVILTAGKNVRGTIYRLVNFFYSEADKFNFNKKNISKIFKICYGKDQIPEVIKCLMLERVRTDIDLSSKESSIDVAIDLYIRDTLEEMDKKDIEKIIRRYIDARKYQEKNGKIRRRFGDRRAIHPDDYPKLTRVFESIEDRDFSLIPYLR